MTTATLVANVPRQSNFDIGFVFDTIKYVPDNNPFIDTIKVFMPPAPPAFAIVGLPNLVVSKLYNVQIIITYTNKSPIFEYELTAGMNKFIHKIAHSHHS